MAACVTSAACIRRLASKACWTPLLASPSVSAGNVGSFIEILLVQVREGSLAVGIRCLAVSIITGDLRPVAQQFTKLFHPLRIGRVRALLPFQRFQSAAVPARRQSLPR